MSNGIDCDSDTTSEIGCLKAAGIEFIARYISRTQRSETDHICSMGLFVVSLYETLGNNYPYFSSNQGTHDGVRTMEYSPALGQPHGTPVYFCVDFDATEAQIRSGIADYFTAVRAEVNANGQGPYKVGVYGSGLVCQILLELGLVEYTYLAAPTDWAGADFTGWNLKQTHNGQSLCNLSVDLDVSQDDGGGWQI